MAYGVICVFNFSLAEIYQIRFILADIILISVKYLF